MATSQPEQRGERRSRFELRRGPGRYWSMTIRSSAHHLSADGVYRWTVALWVIADLLTLAGVGMEMVRATEAHRVDEAWAFATTLTLATLAYTQWISLRSARQRRADAQP